jgi:hypothetical protein
MSASLARFLGAENAQRLAVVMTKYFADTQQVSLDATLGEEAVAAAVADVVRAGAARPGAGASDLEALNKAAAQALREQLRVLLRAPLASDIQAAPQGDDDSFFHRLQDIEAQRRQVNDVPGAPVLAPDPAPASFTPAAVSTIFVPAPPRRGQTLCIRSFARPWHLPALRATLAWAGPLPAAADAGNVRVAACQLPAAVADATPYVRLSVEGVAGATFECILLPGATRGRWSAWRAAAESLAHVRPVPCPWTLRLFDASGQLLDLGADGVLLQARNDRQTTAAEDRAYRTTARCAGEFAPGDVAWVQAAAGAPIIQTRVVAAGAGALELRGPPDADLPDECAVLNWQLQWVVHLELELAALNQTQPR